MTSETNKAEQAETAQVEPMKAWIIEDTNIIEPKPMHIFIGTVDAADAKAEELGYLDAWISGPYEFAIGIKP